jgi:hypothetical protein
MIDGERLVLVLARLGVTHVIWVPDSEIGMWEEALVRFPEVSLVRVCREGEAWPLAAGLHLGGKQPIVVMQTTGLLESGDAMRNVLWDMKLPIFAIVGHRSYLVDGSTDSIRRVAEPTLAAWGVEAVLLVDDPQGDGLAAHYARCRDAQVPGVVLLAEGRM